LPQATTNCKEQWVVLVGLHSYFARALKKEESEALGCPWSSHLEANVRSKELEESTTFLEKEPIFIL
jgi:hypothetical protein